jgi:putative DNA primase/helicase
MTQKPIAAGALQLAARGWRVIPLSGKKPLLTAWPQKATTDPNTILGFWAQYPYANVGVVTGKESNLMVLDNDPRHGGNDSLRALEAKYGPLPETVQVITGSGGSHSYLQYPGPDILNSSGLLAPGLDIKTEGGQVVAPPSIHPETKQPYAWDAEHHPDDVLVAPAPEWLLDEIRNAQNKERKSKHEDGDKIPDGQRNKALTSLGGKLRRQGASVEEIFAALIALNTSRCVRPLPVAEVRSIAESLGRYPADNEPLRLTDVSNSELFAEQHQESFRYCHGRKQSLFWNERRWKQDTNGCVMVKAKQTARSLYALAAEEGDETRRKARARWAAETESAQRLRNMVSLAQSDPRLVINTDKLDADPLLLNVKNGTLDLRTGTLRPACREDFITKMAEVDYVPDAVATEFERLLNRLFEPFPAVRNYLQRILGYALTGLTTEQCFFIFYGSGANGKSTILRTILDLLGDYATTTRPETFLAKHGDNIPNDVAALAGARFVSSLESEQGKKLAEGLMKGMTGGDRITARFLNKEFFSFDPQCKIFIGTNHKPTIKGTDLGMWRRVRCVPFEVVIPPAEQDKHLVSRLRREASGILNWLLQGCLEWQREGLGEPLEVLEATKAYRAEQDVIGAFLKEKCVLEAKARITKRQIYEWYTAWCAQSGERQKMTMREFGNALRERGVKDATVDHCKGWAGIRMRENEDPISDNDDEGDEIPKPSDTVF